MMANEIAVLADLMVSARNNMFAKEKSLTKTMIFLTKPHGKAS